MVRCLVVIACCVLVSGAPLADSLCYARCGKSEVSGTHHSCAPERSDATAISAAPHACAIADETAFRSAEARHAIAALILPPLVRFTPSLPIVSLAGDARFDATGYSPQLPKPLRI